MERYLVCGGSNALLAPPLMLFARWRACVVPRVPRGPCNAATARLAHNAGKSDNTLRRLRRNSPSSRALNAVTGEQMGECEMDAKTASRYHEVYAQWQRDPEGFWAEAAKEIDWFEPADKVFDPVDGRLWPLVRRRRSATPATTRSTGMWRAAAAIRRR